MEMYKWTEDGEGKQKLMKWREMEGDVGNQTSNCSPQLFMSSMYYLLFLHFLHMNETYYTYHYVNSCTYATFECSSENGICLMVKW